ncbi:MAG: hypothetical protein ACJ790_08130 [Myxococcaceae bacterium]
MATTHTLEERLDALQAMFRVRTTETPPDTNGERMIWHQGARGAYLVTSVDASGRVGSQTLTLFDDQITWDSIDGLQTGSVSNGTGAVMDSGRDPEKVGRVLEAFDYYRGEDRYLLHMHRLLMSAAGRKVPVVGNEPVTRPATVISDELRAKAKQALAGKAPGPDSAPSPTASPTANPTGSRRVLVGSVIAAVLIVGAVIAFVVMHGR